MDRVGELVPLVTGQLAPVPLEPAEAAGELAVQCYERLELVRLELVKVGGDVSGGTVDPGRQVVDAHL